jgi:monoamine oxidase
VVVVGAGLAGLVCARELGQFGFRVTVFEARDRVGGRVLTLRDTFAGGQYAELGAELVGERHARVRALARSFGMRLDEVRKPPGVVYRLGRRRLYEEFATPRVQADVRRFQARLASLQGRALDGRSAASLIRELRLADRARFLVEHDLRDTYGVEPENLSLLFLAEQARLGRGRGRRSRIRGGADLLPLALGRGLDIRLETSVRRIEQRPSGITVVAGGDEIDADRCVLAVPVPLLGSIEFEPGLPAVLAAAVERLAYGHGVKTVLQYERRVRNSAVLSDLTFQTAWDTGVRLVTAYTTGRNGILYGTVGRRSRVLLAADELDEVFPGSRGLFELGETVSWHSDGWSRGTAVAYAPAQVGRFREALRRPVGRLLFAGEHTDDYAGTMEGAVRSGLRAARSIAAR